MEQMMDMSPTIGQLAKALAAAQGEITGALKESKNPFFKSSYADLASCWDACRTPLSKNHLAVIQTTQATEGGVKVVTTLAHESGEWMRGTLCMTPTKNDPQGIGSCLTYARRYALAAIVGLAQIDDDANSASGKGDGKSGTDVKPTFTDPKGEAYKSVDPKVRDPFINRLMTALNADREENVMADDLYEIHTELNADSDLYSAVWNEISAKDRRAIKEYINIGKTRASGKVA